MALFFSVSKQVFIYVMLSFTFETPCQKRRFGEIFNQEIIGIINLGKQSFAFTLGSSLEVLI